MSIVLDTDKAYLLWLLVWGWVMKSWGIQIVLPFNKWGKIELDPTRWWIIATDILTRIKPIWKSLYDIDIRYSIERSSWTIILDWISTELKNDLSQLGLLNIWEFRENADIKILESLFNSSEMIRQFIAWMVDTVWSMAESHRRFSSDFQIVSFEFMWRNFSLVLSITRLLLRLWIIPDQVLWNHPNFHSTYDRYYKSWKKWFKLRVVLNDYVLKWSFIFQSKKLSAESNIKLQEDGHKTTIGKEYRIEWRNCLHIDESSEWIPKEIRGFHFLHFTHLASFLGVDFPWWEIRSIITPEKHISPFTILTKWTKSIIDNIIRNEEYLLKTKYKERVFSLRELYSKFNVNRNLLLYWNSENDGFPINIIMQGVAFIIAASSWLIRGNRVMGSYTDHIESAIGSSSSSIGIYTPDIWTCLIISDWKYSCLVGYQNEEFVKNLLVIDWLKIKVKEPDYHDCIPLPN